MKIAPLVLAGGKPGLFEKLTGNLPKTYLKVGGRRLYQYAADALTATFGRVYVASPYPENAPYIYVEERGRAIEQAILTAETYLGAETHILLVYGDVYVEPAAYRTLVETAISAGADGAVLAVPRKPREATEPSRLSPEACWPASAARASGYSAERPCSPATS